MGVVNVLHISDLHRGKANQVRNPALLDSLISDLHYYMHDVSKIDIITVCGDLVQGVLSSEITRTDEIASQYSEAEAFISDLCAKLVGGCREKVVIVPGNHDMSWPHSESSMKPKNLALVSDERRSLVESLVKEAMIPESKTRWSWHDLCFMEIQDQTLYSRRMEQFCKFYDSFYEGRRSYSLAPEDQFSVYDYPDLDIAILGLNSCDCLDHCNTVGRFNPEALGKALMELKRTQYNSRVKIAVWHHGLYGPPLQSDYLDPLCAQNLIVNRFALGLHGHQHVPDFLTELGRFGYESKMLVVGAGTLCGIPEALPPGQMRNYNVISLDTETGEVRLYPREMKQSNFQTPVWGKKALPYSDDYPIVVKLIVSPQYSDSKTEDFRNVANAEELMGKTQYEEALVILETLNSTDEIVRRLLIECYFNLRKSERIIELCREPTSVLEAIYVLGAADDVDDRPLIAELLRHHIVSESDDPSLVELCRRLQRRIPND